VKSEETFRKPFTELIKLLQQILGKSLEIKLKKDPPDNMKYHEFRYESKKANIKQIDEYIQSLNKRITNEEKSNLNGKNKINQ